MSEQAEGRESATDAAAIHRRIVELVGAGQRDEALALIDDDAIDHRGGIVGDRLGVGVWKAKWEHMNDGLLDVSLTIEQNVAAGDFSVNRYTVRGRHAATGRRYKVTGIDMVRVRAGKIVEHWALLDSTAMRNQLGVDDTA